MQPGMMMEEILYKRKNISIPMMKKEILYHICVI